MIKYTSFLIRGSRSYPILLDLRYDNNEQKKPLIIFAHGFKGFKDWGHFNLISEVFAKAGFVFLKFNFSHNGTTSTSPCSFTDLDAFGKNNFSTELADLERVVDEVSKPGNFLPDEEIDRKNIFLIGHSRGGGICVLKASRDKRIKKLTTWSSVSDFWLRWTADQRERWKKEKVLFINNTRTNQQMPMYYQIVEDLEQNRSNLDVPEAVRQLKIPYLIIHGEVDESISLLEAKQLNSWNSDYSEIVLIENANHTYGGYEPYDKNVLPIESDKLIRTTLEFFKR